MHKLESAPAFKIAFIFIIGILIGASFKFNIFVILPLILIQIIFLFYFYKTGSEKNTFLILISFLIILLGIFKANIDFYLIPDNSVSHLSETKRNEETKIIGVIEDIPAFDTNKIKFTLSTEFLINENNHDTLIINGDILVTLKRNYKTDINENQEIQSSGNIDYDKPPDLKAGDRVLMYGRLIEPFEERNPGEFNYKRYLFLHNIYKTFSVVGFSNVEIINRNNISFTDQSLFEDDNLETASVEEKDREPSENDIVESEKFIKRVSDTPVDQEEDGF